MNPTPESSTVPPSSTEPSTSPSGVESVVARRLKWVRLIGLVTVALTAAAVMTIWGAEAALNELQDRATSGWQGVALFVVFYAVATAALVPGSVPTAAAGAVYGAAGGGAVSVVGATLGATLGYLISRTVARGPAEELLAPRVSQIEAWLADHQFRTVLVLRLLPIIPFSLFNYAAGLTPIRLLPFVAGTAIGILPGTFLLALVGDSLTDPTSPAFVGSVAAFLALVVGSSFIARRLGNRSSSADV